MPTSLALLGGRIWTGDPCRPWAQSVQVNGSLITALDQPADSRSGVIDLAGRFAMPAFIDSHLHLLMGGAALGQLNLSEINSREQFEAAIAAEHLRLPRGEWLIARGWNESRWGGLLPNSGWLHGAQERPCVCWRMDQHAALVNEAVLRLLPSTADPPDGRWTRDQNGRPTGLAFEGAAWGSIVPVIPDPGIAAKRRALRRATTHLHSLGVATVGAMEYLSDVEQVVEAGLAEEPGLRVALTLLDRAADLDLAPILRLRDRCTSRRDLQVVGCKSFADGTLGSRTARMLDRYCDDGSTQGMLLDHARAGTLAEWMRTVGAAGLSPSVHAIGDAAIRAVLDAADASGLPTAQVRFEHCQTIAGEDISRFRGRFASMQPLHRAHDAPIATARLGTHRLNRCFPLASLESAGARLAFGSDWPIVSADPLAGMRAAIAGLDMIGNRIPWAECVSVESALTAYTRNAATCLGLAGITGTITPGFAADIAILDCDPFNGDWLHSPPRVDMLIVGGQPAAMRATQPA